MGILLLFDCTICRSLKKFSAPQSPSKVQGEIDLGLVIREDSQVDFATGNVFCTLGGGGGGRGWLGYTRTFLKF